MELKVSRQEWWLDGSALPNLLWARLTVFDATCVEVLDLDGRYRFFESEEAARLWLAEDEYEPLEGLVREGDLGASVVPPSAPTDEALIPRMAVRLPDTKA